MQGLRRYTAGIVAAAALLAAAGCGGSTNSGAGGDAAGVVPASATVFVSVDTDLDSDQWSTVQSLLDEFPGKSQLLAQLRQSFEQSSNGVTWDDVKAALGPEVDVAVLGLGGNGQKADVVGLTQPNDPSKFDQLVQKGNASDQSGGKLFTADYKGWKIFSDSQANLDTFEQEADAGPALSDDASYGDATSKLPGSALAKAYVDGARLTAALKQKLQTLQGATQQNGKLDWIAADLASQSDGLKVEAFTKTAGTAKTPAPYTAKLPDEAPAGALLYASFNGQGLNSTSMRRAMNGLESVPQAAQLLPVLKQLGTLFGHENALYVLPGAGIPEVTLVAEPDSTQQGLASIDQLVASLGQALKPKPITIGAVSAKELNLGRFSIYYGALGGKVVVSDTQQAFQELQASGQKLADDPTFEEAEQAAGMPSQTNGFLYVNLKDSIPLVEGLAQLGGQQVPPIVTNNLRPLRTLVAWASANGGEGRSTLFLEVK